MNIIDEYNGMSAASAYKQLDKMGLTREVIDACGGAVACRAVTEGGLFMPSSGGVPMIVHAVNRTVIGYQHVGMIEVPTLMQTGTDLVAWSPSDPDKWYLRNAASDAMLGSEHLFFATGSYHDELHVFKSPWEWLCGGGKGVCPLTPRAEYMLCCVPNIVVYSAEMKTRLSKSLSAVTALYMPEIEIGCLPAVDAQGEDEPPSGVSTAPPPEAVGE